MTWDNTRLIPIPACKVVDEIPVRASPPVLSMWLQTVKFIVKKSKCAGLAQEIGFFCTNFVHLSLGGKSRNTIVHLQKNEGNKSDLTAAQYFWLVDHNDWARWFAISSSCVYAIPVTVLIGGVAKKTQLYLDI
jgi:hypothetical protein